jgi:hypothetical protein
MQTAGARILPEDEPQGMNREAVLLEWERKIEEGERRQAPTAGVTETATHAAPRRFERRERGEAPAAGERLPADAAGAATTAPVAERRTITISSRPAPMRRRRSVVENQLAQPDRIALWAFLLGLFLVAVAAGTAHA